MKWALVVAIPLCVRAAYGIIGVAVSSGSSFLLSDWSPLFGSATAFGLMALLPEYLALCTYIYLSTYHLRTRKQEGIVEGGAKQRSSDMS